MITYPWNLFKNRNNHPAHAQVVEYHQLTHQSSRNHNKSTIHLAWDPPQREFYNLNTDGACLGSPGKRGIGVVTRDHSSNWITGFHKGFTNATTIQMEILALKEGLKLAKEKNLYPIEINIDSLEVIHLFHKANIQFNNLLYDCRLILRELEGPTVLHCYRE